MRTGISGWKHVVVPMAGDARGYLADPVSLSNTVEGFLVAFDGGIREIGDPQDCRVLMALGTGENHSGGRGGCSRVAHPTDPVCPVTGYTGWRDGVTFCHTA